MKNIFFSMPSGGEWMILLCVLFLILIFIFKPVNGMVSRKLKREII